MLVNRTNAVLEVKLQLVIPHLQLEKATETTNIYLLKYSLYIQSEYTLSILYISEYTQLFSNFKRWIAWGEEWYYYNLQITNYKAPKKLSNSLSPVGKQQEHIQLTAAPFRSHWHSYLIMMMHIHGPVQYLILNTFYFYIFFEFLYLGPHSLSYDLLCCRWKTI